MVLDFEQRWSYTLVTHPQNMKQKQLFIKDKM